MNVSPTELVSCVRKEVHFNIPDLKRGKALELMHAELARHIGYRYLHHEFYYNDLGRAVGERHYYMIADVESDKQAT